MLLPGFRLLESPEGLSNSLPMSRFFNGPAIREMCRFTPQMSAAQTHAGIRSNTGRAAPPRVPPAAGGLKFWCGGFSAGWGIDPASPFCYNRQKKRAGARYVYRIYR